MTKGILSYQDVRQQTVALCASLKTEDFCAQSMPDVSPTKWHLAHTTWFFETFILSKAMARYRSYNDCFKYLFNSYYNGIGEQFPRESRGLLSRPTVEEVLDYRKKIDQQMVALLRNKKQKEKWNYFVQLGLHHEQQHQELIITDIKHVFSLNPLQPVYKKKAPKRNVSVGKMNWVRFNEEETLLGHEGVGFHFDNEGPLHRATLIPFQIANRLVTNGEYLKFIEAGGYKKSQYWLSKGWEVVQREKWNAPLYWKKEGKEWFVMTLTGIKKVNTSEPVCHVSYYEADAFASWMNARLPSEAEWERASQEVSLKGNFVQKKSFHPQPVEKKNQQVLDQLFGDVWEWTRSPYVPYPGYVASKTAVGEYNGKFMCNQMVLRGGSCATSQDHIRSTYRNFFYPEDRWQFSGIRLAKDL